MAPTETPLSATTSSMLASWKPFATNTRRAASRMCLRFSASWLAVIRGMYVASLMALN